MGLSPTLHASAERELGGNWSGYAAAGYAVRHPDFSELYYTDTGAVRGNPDLAPERLLSAEVGFRHAGADHRVGPPSQGPATATARESSCEDGRAQWPAPSSRSSIEAAAFWNHYYDSILFLPVSAYLVQATNTGGASVAGAELGWRAPVSSSLAWSGAATWLPIAEMADGTPLPQRAPLRANTRLDWQRPNWSAYAAADYAARTPADLHGNLRIRARVLVDCGVARDFDGDELALAVTNLFDQSSRDSWNYPLPGREINLTWRTSL